MTALNVMRTTILSFGLFMVWPAGAAIYHVEEACDIYIKRITQPDYICVDNRDWPSEVKDDLNK